MAFSVKIAPGGQQGWLSGLSSGLQGFAQGWDKSADEKNDRLDRTRAADMQGLDADVAAWENKAKASPDDVGVQSGLQGALDRRASKMSEEVNYAKGFGEAAGSGFSKLGGLVKRGAQKLPTATVGRIPGVGQYIPGTDQKVSRDVQNALVNGEAGELTEDGHRGDVFHYPSANRTVEIIQGQGNSQAFAAPIGWANDQRAADEYRNLQTRNAATAQNESRMAGQDAGIANTVSPSPSSDGGFTSGFSPDAISRAQETLANLRRSQSGGQSRPSFNFGQMIFPNNQQPSTMLGTRGVSFR